MVPCICSDYSVQLVEFSEFRVACYFLNDPTGRISIYDLDGDCVFLPRNPKDRVLGFKMF